MRAVVATGRPEKPTELRDVAEPEPRDDEALVAVEYVSLNRGEARRLAAADEGWRPGWDVAGTVRDPARDASGPSAGERVVGFMSTGAGGWAERVAVRTDRLSPIPDGVSTAQAATLPTAGITALRTLRIGGLLLGKRLLVTGAAGGVGRFAIELAARAGAEITGVVRSAERGTGLRELGAHELVTSIDDARGPFDLILESVGGRSLTTALDLMAPAGTVVSFGYSSGEETTFAASPWYLKGRPTVVGFTLFFEGSGESYADDLLYLMRLVADDALHPQLAVERQWTELGETMRDLDERRIAGKAVLRVSQ
ncbi:MAG TPA: zinc-binding dehydrogenase [Gaiellaceae bacterium]|nr:zinc-binding dehydrogenase [Gaiellaceae bacterium]